MTNHPTTMTIQGYEYPPPSIEGGTIAVPPTGQSKPLSPENARKIRDAVESTSVDKAILPSTIRKTR